MAQTGYTPISIYYSSTASAAPTAGNLVAGELAINTADGKLFYKDSAGVVQVIGTKGGVGSSTTTQVLYNSSGLVVGSANLTFNGTTLTVANDASISGLTVGKGGGAVATNTVVGANSAFATNSSGTGNSVFGNQAMTSNTSGANNNAFGLYALGGNTTGGANSAFGYTALSANTTGSNNTAYGNSALQSNTTASNNTAVGYQAGYSNTTGDYSTFVGRQSGYTNTTGRLVAIGHQALYANTTGTQSTAVGDAALGSNTTGNYNTALGYTALFSNTTASNNTAVGYQAGYSNTTGALNIFVGPTAGFSNTTGTQNVAIGGGASGVAFSASQQNNTGSYNTVVGVSALGQNVGSYNTVVGNNAGINLTSGSKNTIIGRFDGNQGGLNISTASNYIVLSDGDGNPRGVFDGSGTFFLGAFTSPSGTQRLVLTANGSTGIEPMLFNELRSTSATENYVRFYRNGSQVGAITNTLSATAYVTSSDYRLKENVAPMTGALAKVAQLKPVTYKWKVDGSDGQGFIAHELQTVVPDCVSGEKDAVDAEGNPQYQGIDTSFLVATLTAAIQELKAEFDAYKETHP